MTWLEYWRWMRERPFLSTGVGFLLLVWVIADFSTRIWSGRDRSLREFKPPAPVVIPEMPKADAVNAAIDAWLPRVSPAEQAPPPREIVPQGVFRSAGTSVAIVLLKASDTQPEERRRLVVGDMVEGERVELIEYRRIVLAKDGQTRELVLLRGKP